MAGSISQAAQPVARPNDEERGQPRVPMRAFLARTFGCGSAVPGDDCALEPARMRATYWLRARKNKYGVFVVLCIQ